jgi:hypothetical protein
VKERGSCVKPGVATVSLARGVFGGDRHARIETEREQLNPGEFPKTLTPCASVHQYQYACTWTRTYNSLYLSLNRFTLRPFHASNSNQYCTHLFLSFVAVQRSNVRIFLFLFTNLIIYINNLTDTYFTSLDEITLGKRSFFACFDGDSPTHFWVFVEQFIIASWFSTDQTGWCSTGDPRRGNMALSWGQRVR